MATESAVQVAPDSTGKKVRTTEVTTPQGTTEQQVITPATPEGILLDDATTRFDYTTRTDGNPVYIGINNPGAADTDATWTIKQLTWDASGRCTAIKVATGVQWANRATTTYS